MEERLKDHPLNTILYGPPGTGKTYQSIRRAIQIVEQRDDQAYEAAYPDSQPAKRQEAFRRYQAEGRIAFITFHPSFSYEDFVEGLKPFRNEKNDLYYDLEDGIFKQICLNAAYALYQHQQQRELSTQYDRQLNFEALYLEFVDYLNRMLRDDEQEVIFETKAQKPLYLEEINQHQTLRFRYQQGSRTYGVSKAKLGRLYRHFENEPPARVEEVQAVIGKGKSSIYWAVFQRFRAFVNTRTTTFNYLLGSKRLAGRPIDDELYQGLKREISRFDFFLLNQKDLQEAGNYVLIIDEINRGNVSAILGELISLLESDKRAGRSAELRAVLPYSRERFTVPPNLYLLGTMNTADRSISSLDTALRRRFVFEELLPRAELLEAETAKEANTEVAEDAGGYRAASDWPDLARMLAMINRRLELMLDREHTIGHAYLMGIQAEEQKIKRLRQVFYKQLIPLLQEYFYDDFDKIVRIIGPAFFDERREDPSLFFHGTPDDFGWQDGFSQKKNYVLRPLSDRDFLKAVRQIYEPLSA